MFNPFKIQLIMEVRNKQIWIYSAFGRKFYINYGSILRAARLKKVDFFLGSMEFQCTYEVAGLGIVEEELVNTGTSIYCKKLGVYESLDAFKEGRFFGDMKDRVYNGTNFPGIRLTTEEILTKAFDSIANVRFDDKKDYYYVEVYRWNGVKAEAVNITGNVWMDEEGFHTDAKIPTGTYATKEECEKANQISVIEFEDEE